MEIKKIKELMTTMVRNKMKKLRIKEGDFEIELERECKNSKRLIENFSNNSNEIIERGASVASEDHSEIPTSLTHPVSQGENLLINENDQFVTSPMVGTFYFASTPEEAPFIKIGDTVDKDTLVCIIEAMKVMNEVKANIDGTVTKVLVENGHPVEFGTKLFLISKNH